MLTAKYGKRVTGGLWHASAALGFFLLACHDSSGKPAGSDGGTLSPGLTLVLDIRNTSRLGDPPFTQAVGGSVMGNGNILIADAGERAIRVISPQGKLLKTSGREGGGPGEFQNVKWARQCESDSLFVWDVMLSRVSVLTGDGGFVRHFPTPGRPGIIECAPGGHFAILMNPSDLQMPDPNGRGPHYSAPLLLANSNGDSTGMVGVVPAFEFRALGKRTNLSVSGNRIYVGTQDSAFISTYDLSGKPAEGIAAGIEGRKTTQAAYERAADHIASPLTVASERKAYRDMLLKIPMPEYLAPYFELLPAAGGGVWVQTSAPGEGKTVLSRFSESGAAMGVLEIPRELQVFEIGRAHLLGAYEDPDGSQHVVLYSLPGSERPT